LKLPPLSALRAFESVARLGSVTQAANELHVTHSAVSHQLKLLESYLNVSLIDRTGRRVALTPEGRIYGYQVRHALQQVASATSRINMRTQNEHLTVAVLPSFATHWLVPRLPDFYAQYPHWRIELLASLEIIDFETSPADCAIRFGRVESAATQSERLMSEWQLLVAGAHDARFDGHQTPAQALQAAAFINNNESWGNWLTAAQSDASEPEAMLVINDSSVALEAVRNNMGAMLSRLSICDAGLRQGWLRQITSIRAAHPSSYHLLWPNRSHQSDKLLIFAEWLKAQCAQFERESLLPTAPTGQPLACGFLHSD
jgi:LysR family transcriptional regulator, glycine cleavage system transcriptional activator